MKTKIFAYKGHLGAKTDITNGKFINDPMKPGQLGCVIDVKEIEINQSAKDMLSNASRDGGSFSEIMLTRHVGDNAKENGEASVGLMGADKHYFGTSDKVQIGRDCDKSILELIEVKSDEEIVPDDFKRFIDNLE